MLQRNLKEFRLRRDSNPCLPDNSWTQLATELRNHTLAVRQTLERFSLWIGNLSFFSLNCRPNIQSASYHKMHNSPWPKYTFSKLRTYAPHHREKMVVLYTFQNIGQENLDWFRAEGESGRKRDI